MEPLGIQGRLGQGSGPLGLERNAEVLQAVNSKMASRGERWWRVEAMSVRN